MKPCKHCSSSGVYIGILMISEDCKYCNGMGWINEDEIISVPRKYVNNEYFEIQKP